MIQQNLEESRRIAKELAILKQKRELLTLNVKALSDSKSDLNKTSEELKTKILEQREELTSEKVVKTTEIDTLNESINDKINEMKELTQIEASINATIKELKENNDKNVKENAQCKDMMGEMKKAYKIFKIEVEKVKVKSNNEIRELKGTEFNLVEHINKRNKEYSVLKDKITKRSKDFSIRENDLKIYESRLEKRYKHKLI